MSRFQNSGTDCETLGVSACVGFGVVHNLHSRELEKRRFSEKVECHAILTQAPTVLEVCGQRVHGWDHGAEQTCRREHRPRVEEEKEEARPARAESTAPARLTVIFSATTLPQGREPFTGAPQ